MYYSLDLEKIEFKFQIKETTNRLEISPISGSPCQRLSQDISNTTRFEILSFRPNDTNFYLDLTGKQDDDTLVQDGIIVDDCKIVLENLWVNDILIEIWALEDMYFFEPWYSDSARQYANKTGMDLPSRLFNQCEFWANGRLFFAFADFFQIYYQKLLAPLKKFNSWVTSSHLGVIDEHTKQECRVLIDQINNLKKH